jgi:hypothetical protein
MVKSLPVAIVKNKFSSQSKELDIIRSLLPILQGRFLITSLVKIKRIPDAVWSKSWRKASPDKFPVLSGVATYQIWRV